MYGDFDLSELSNDELERHLYEEFLYYDEDLHKLAHIFRKELPKKYVWRILSKLYRVRSK